MCAAGRALGPCRAWRQRSLILKTPLSGMGYLPSPSGTAVVGKGRMSPHSGHCLPCACSLSLCVTQVCALATGVCTAEFSRWCLVWGGFVEGATLGLGVCGFFLVLPLRPGTTVVFWFWGPSIGHAAHLLR